MIEILEKVNYICRGSQRSVLDGGIIYESMSSSESIRNCACQKKDSKCQTRSARWIVEKTALFSALKFSSASPFLECTLVCPLDIVVFQKICATSTTRHPGPHSMDATNGNANHHHHSCITQPLLNRWLLLGSWEAAA